MFLTQEAVGLLWKQLLQGNHDKTSIFYLHHLERFAYSLTNGWKVLGFGDNFESQINVPKELQGQTILA